MTSTLKIADWTPEYFIANRGKCSGILETSDALHQIPVLNDMPLHDFWDRQLVRFRGMIQDMHNPEYYFQQYEIRNNETGITEIKSGMYADSARCLPHEEILLESESNETAERQTCVVISTPGLNDWVRKKYKCRYNSGANLQSNPSCKRSLNEDMSEQMHCSQLYKKKEKMSLDGEMDVECHTKENILSKEHILNFPIPIDDGKACIVKIYDETNLKLNQVLEIVGFISLDPFLSTVHDADVTMSDAEINTHYPPASLVPRLHAVKVVQCAKHEITNVPAIISKAQSIRSDLHMILSQLLFGDALAADYLICHFLSAIYMRKDFICLGNYSLNITHFPAAKYKMFPKDFYHFLTLLITKSHFVDITLDNLNELAFMPKKDYECNRLTSGILQLSNNTHLVIDETGLTTGQVSQAGRENYNAICDLINFQKVTYDFKFYKMEYEIDLPVLILSEAKSFFTCSTQIMLKTDADSENLYPQVLEIAQQYLKDEDRLSNIRQYFEVLKHAEFEFNEDIVSTVHQDFLRLRQANKNVSVDHLHSLMILARLISLSYGSRTLTSEYWKRAVDMEMERLNRLSRQK